MKHSHAAIILIFSSLLVFQIPNALATESTFKGVTFASSNDVKLTFETYGRVLSNGNLVIAVSGYFNARSNNSNLQITFANNYANYVIEDAEAYTDTVLYYVGENKNMFVGSYYNNISISLIKSTHSVLFNMDLSSEASNVLNYFKPNVPNLNINDVGFGGRIFIVAEFNNSVGSAQNKGF